MQKISNLEKDGKINWKWCWKYKKTKETKNELLSDLLEPVTLFWGHRIKFFYEKMKKENKTINYWELKSYINEWVCLIKEISWSKEITTPYYSYIKENVDNISKKSILTWMCSFYKLDMEFYKKLSK